MKTVYQCNDSICGIFSAIHDAWLACKDPESVGIVFDDSFEMELFASYILVEETKKKELLVTNLLKKHFGEDVFQRLLYALFSANSNKGTYVLRTMLEARKISSPRRILEHLTNDAVMGVFELSRAVGGEAHEYTGFIRFRELRSGILFSKIKPKNSVLYCMEEHFSNRFPLEHFVIYDETHNYFLVHPAHGPSILVQSLHVNHDFLEDTSLEEEEFQALWKQFCKSISIKERENYILQRGNLPLRYRPNMIEFDKRDVI